MLLGDACLNEKGCAADLAPSSKARYLLDADRSYGGWVERLRFDPGNGSHGSRADHLPPSG
jgi:hypothetical protein